MRILTSALSLASALVVCGCGSAESIDGDYTGSASLSVTFAHGSGPASALEETPTSFGIIDHGGGSVSVNAASQSAVCTFGMTRSGSTLVAALGQGGLIASECTFTGAFSGGQPQVTSASGTVSSGLLTFDFAGQYSDGSQTAQGFTGHATGQRK